MKEIIAIFTSDLHIQENAPVCRTDDYLTAIESKLLFLTDLQEKLSCEVYDAGDIFSKWKVSNSLLNFCFKNLPKMTTIVGNHDMPHHNMSFFEDSGLSVLEHGPVSLLLNRWESISSDWCIYGLPYGDTEIIEEDSSEIRKRKILLSHQMCWHNEKPYPTVPDSSNAKSILKKYPQFDIIITGHNHQSFEVEHEGRTLINIGSMMRSSVIQEDFKPRVMLLYSDGSFKFKYFPIMEDVVSLDHIEILKQKDERIEKFAENLSNEESCDLDYEKNIHAFFNNNRIRSKVKEIVLECIGA